MYRVAKRRVSDVRSIPAPVKGLNAKDSIANMEDIYALVLDNMFCNTSSCDLRRGYEFHRTGLLSNVKTLIPFRPWSGSEKLLAVCDGGIFDITSPGSAALTNLRSSQSDGDVNYAMFSTVAANYAVVVNGTNPSFLYDGSVFTTLTFTTGTPAFGQIKGVNPDNFVQVHAHKRRLWFVEKNTMTAWYLPVDQVSGEVKPLYLGSVFTKGGKLQNVFTWSLDSGSGLDDILVFQSSEGELACYQGTDPDNASSWTLVSVHYSGAPLGYRTYEDSSGDVLLLTQVGIIPISGVISGDASVSEQYASISQNIANLISTELRLRGNSPKWEIIRVPKYEMLVVNLPKAGSYAAVQYVMNLVTGAWSRFKLPIKTMCLFGSELMFSDEDSMVHKFGRIYKDAVTLDGSGGSEIVGVIQTSHSYLEARGVNKHYKMVRPTFVSSQKPSYMISLSLDFSPVNTDSTGTPPPSGDAPSSIWGISTWGSAVWYAGPSAHSEWVGVAGLGYSVSAVVVLRGSTDIQLVSMDWLYESATSI